MSKGVIIGVIVLLLILGGGMWYLTSQEAPRDSGQSDAIPASVETFASPSENAPSGAQVTSGESESTAQESEAPAQTPLVHEIAVDAKKFEFTPNIIRVKEGEHVKITLTVLDGSHGMAIPDFNVQGRDTLEFVADKKGTFTFYCNTYCGAGHSEMKGTLIVE